MHTEGRPRVDTGRREESHPQAKESGLKKTPQRPPQASLWPAIFRVATVFSVSPGVIYPTVFLTLFP